MTLFADFLEYAANSRLKSGLKDLERELGRLGGDNLHGRRAEWEALLAQVPVAVEVSLDFNRPTLQIGKKGELSPGDGDKLLALLKGLHPWRKGPFDFFGIHIDTEWRSDWKWERVSPHLKALEGRTILDVGCGSGYHCWRMLADGARRVVGLDPSQLFWFQFRMVKHFYPEAPVDYLPMVMEVFPRNTGAFDTVFSMGVLYHRRSPFEHLQELKDALCPGGELVLETLITKGDLHHAFVPTDRYAQMRNVFFLPSVPTLLHWVERAGFKNARVVDVNQTSLDEQRATEWMTFQSLSDFVDPNDLNKTIEGYPAPTRAVVLAEK
ncbi:MAG: tRNA 5-methoxyuridine(34)/uridine 5-oxyacetic acid(34) synthase CmoB [Myxococcota bacterium]|nr:tRNA 5-methoxyuridine(34)/uridine 5-oxyacetic acid(34) synthase CmoB [Myxococcota bacterium]